MVLVTRRDERSLVDLDLWLIRAGVTIAPVDQDLADAAIAWLAYGKGRHAAGLDFADCLSYALARRSGEPLLFKGDDFSRTDSDALRPPPDRRRVGSRSSHRLSGGGGTFVADPSDADTTLSRALLVCARRRRPG